MGNQAEKKTFDSWKEIAAYLRRTEKTCRRWEKDLGLPIHRLEESPRARVYAHKDEIDAWVIKAGDLGAPADATRRRARGSGFLKSRRIRIVSALGAVVVLLGLWMRVDRQSRPRSSSRAFRSIGVLPFEDLSPGKDREYLADGMTDALINALGSVPGLRVPARTSSFFFKGWKKPLSEAARMLHADALIEGSIQVSEGMMRLTVQMVNVSDGYHLWSKKYDQPLDEVFSIQDEIAREVIAALKLDLPPGQDESSAEGFTRNREAYDCYLRGLFHAHRGERSREGLERAIEFYGEAVKRDPEYALAYAGLADAWFVLPNYSPYPRDRAYAEARKSAIKALELNPRLAEAHVAYGCYLSEVERDRRGEIEHFMKAVALKPGYAWGHNMLAYSLLYQGRIDEALQEGRRALDLDPLSCVISRDQGGYLYWAGKYDEAIEEFHKALELYPDHAWTHYYLGCSHLEKAQYDKALAAFQRAFGDSPHLFSIYQGLTYATMGKKAEARAILNDLLREEDSIDLSMKYFHLAALCLNAGEKEKGFLFLRKSEQNRDQQLGFIKIHPFFKHLHAEPEFQSVVRSMRLE